MAPERPGALAAIAADLRCPVCGSPVALASQQVRCARGHAFDLARQGYVSLTTGRGGPGTGDSAAMVMARDRFLSGGHYAPIASAVAALAQSAAVPGLVLDLAGGTGYYLATVLSALPERAGASVDLSAPALRRAARAHPRAAAIGANAWDVLPFAAGSAALVLSVFGPRNAPEIRRVLAPGGLLVMVTPGPGHLRELRPAVDLIGIDEHKAARLDADYGPAEMTPLRYRMKLGHADVTDLVAMGPSARHLSPDALAAQVAALPDTVAVSVDVELRTLTELG